MQRTKKILILAAVTALSGLSYSVEAATVRTWTNTGTSNWNTASNWSLSGVPGATETAQFTGASVTSPTISTTASVLNILFSSTTTTGYNIAGSGANTLTLNGTGTTASLSAINASNTSGTNTISAPLILAQTTVARFQQAPGGGLTISGAISGGASGLVLTLQNGGVFTFNGSNSYSGTTAISGATLNINSATALGSSTLASSGNSSFIDNTSGGSLTLSNGIALNTITSPRGLTFIGTGGSSLTFTGGVNVSQANSALNVTTAGAKLTVGAVTYSGRLDQSAGQGVLVLSAASTVGTGLSEALGGVNYNTAAALTNGDGGALEVGNAGAFGTASASSNVVRLGGGAIRAGASIAAIGNTFVVSGGSPTISGSNNIEFSGDFILNNAAESRTLSVTNTAGTKWSGTISLSDVSLDTTNVLGFDVAGTAGPTEVSGVIRDTNNGTGTGGILKQNTGTLLLSGTNTYTGTTAVRDGTLQLTGSLASAAVTLGNGLTSGRLVLGGAGGAANLNLTSLTAVGTGTSNVIVGGNSASATNSAITINPAADQVYSGALGGAGANENKIALTKSGAFEFTISGPNNTAIAGPVDITGGTLSFGGATAGTTASTGAITVSDNAILRVRTNQVSSTRLTSTSLSLGSAGTARIHLDFGGLSNPTAPLISTGALTAPGTAVTLTADNGTALTSGTFTILDYTSLSDADFAKFSPTVSLGGRTSGALSKNNVNTSLDLTVSTAVPTWNGNISGNWDIDTTGADDGINSTKNFQVGGVGTAYRQTSIPGDLVVFDDSATGTTTVSIPATVNPAQVTVNNTTKNYTFTGPGSISGGTSLIKTGTGTLTIDNVNNYSGATTINAGGTLAVTANGQLGSGSPLNLNSATANLNGTVTGAVLGLVTATSSSAVKLLSATAIPAGITLTDSSLDLNGFSPTIVSLNGSGASTINSSVAGATTLTVSGAGTYTYGGAISNGSGTVALSKTTGGSLLLTANSSYSGGTTISAGLIQANANSALGAGPVTISGGQLLLGPGASVGNSLVINGPAGASGQGILHAPAGSDATYSGTINITNTWGTNSGHFASGAGGQLTLTGTITSSVMVGVRSGTVVFAAPGSSYTDIGSSVSSGGSATIKLGATNGIATNATLNHSQLPTFDLAGFNQSLVGMTASGTGSSGVITTNTVVGTSTLTITGFSDWPGHIQDGGPGMLMALVVNNPGFNFIMENSNTHTGGTTLVDGQLTAMQAANPTGGNSNLTTINGGVFDIETSTSINSLAVNGGTVLSTGNRTLTFGGDDVSRTYSGVFTNSAGSFGIAKNGAGTITMSAANSYTGATTANGGKLLFMQSQTTTSAINASGGTIELAAAANPTVATNIFRTQSMNPSSGGKIDLQNNKAILTAQNVANATALVLAGRNTGNWDGPNGIITSQSNALLAQNITTLAVAAASDVRPGTATFGSIDPADSDTLVMYTYNGDANLSGNVDADDYFAIDSNYSKSGIVFGFNNGDFNYDNLINGDDYVQIDAGFAGQGASIAPGASVGGVSAVPEPGTLSLIGLAAGGLMRRRRQRR